MIKLLNDRFYYIDFDAESTETFQLFGKTFEPGKNKIHEFAEEILKGKSAYPAWVIINPDLEIIFEYEGLIKTQDLKAILEKLIN
ncbi:hypothetical protein HU137_09125 [Moheibacter sp. BDHS18]|uniref:Uncharacterized protein n=1 Tax=Moheibacter lacus TaxID=2745851 RepID=A0A838ZSI4_9FLAO|nr:hypothetical protein [Moheibacter lacus]